MITMRFSPFAVLQAEQLGRWLGMAAPSLTAREPEQQKASL